jgi:hypothetical protein
MSRRAAERTQHRRCFKAGGVTPASDEVVEDKGVRILIDPKAVLFLLGAEMGLQSRELAAQFFQLVMGHGFAPPLPRRVALAAERAQAGFPAASPGESGGSVSPNKPLITKS